MYNLIFATLFNAIIIYLGNHCYGIIGGAAAFSLTMVLLNLLRLAQLQYFYRMLPLSFERASPLAYTISAITVSLIWKFTEIPEQTTKILVTFSVTFIFGYILVRSDRNLQTMRHP